MDIANYFKYNELLSSGAQPSTAQIEALKAAGFEAIVNISPVSTRNALKDEAQVVEKLQMDYVHFPVDCSNLRPFHYNTFSGIMAGLDGKKVFVHCGGNIKSSNLIHMYHVLEKGIDEAESLKTLKQIQNPEEKWFSYFKSFGMQGMQ
ncbi:MAG TPA: protein tyrosine phosphatase family protein [Bacteroidales bacterium]|nr:protein tyrosine phosphatase family protein [Bacteroidales bacterium]